MQTKAVPIQNRAHRTRAILIEAVERIVATSGPDAVTTTSVAQQSGLAVGTIYRYFPHRDALLLASYDATVSRIVDSCAAALDEFDPTLPPQDAALALLAIYLDTADAIPSHAGLLAAMRAIRPIEMDQHGPNEPTIVAELLAAFMARYGQRARPDEARLHFMSILLGTLVDLYLITPGNERQRLRPEIEAHMVLALQRTLAPSA